MNIAVCISGGIKYPEKSLESLKNIFPSDNIKVFIHTWKIIDKNLYLKNIGKEQLLPYLKNDVKKLNQFLKESSEDKLDILNEYNYEKLSIEIFDEKKIEFQTLFDSLTFPSYQRKDVGFISMFYSFYKSNELKKEYERENNMIFDRVIRMRFDSDFCGKKLFLDEIDGNLVIPYGPDWKGMNDQFAIGDSKSMDYYCKIYKNLENLQHVQFHPETLMMEHLSNINVQRIKFDVKINSNT